MKLNAGSYLLGGLNTRKVIGSGAVEVCLQGLKSSFLVLISGRQSSLLSHALCIIVRCLRYNCHGSYRSWYGLSISATESASKFHT